MNSTRHIGNKLDSKSAGKHRLNSGLLDTLRCDRPGQKRRILLANDAQNLRREQVDLIRVQCVC